MDHVRILGTRGSVPVGGAGFMRYGGATTCVLVELGGQYAVLDAGTGLMELPQEALDCPEIPVLLTHLHIDHLLGLPLCPYLFAGGRRKMTVYSGIHEGMSAQEAMERLYSPPLWPISLSRRLRFRPLEPDFYIGALRVETMQGVHPNGIQILRLSAAGKTVVFATDCTLTEALMPQLAEFARDCDLLLCDGQYSDEEWEKHATFGHSTWHMAAALALRSGAKAFRVIHHDPGHDDEQMDVCSGEIRRLCPTGSAARQGEVIIL